jgi:hypothetical protein
MSECKKAQQTYRRLLYLQFLSINLITKIHGYYEMNTAIATMEIGHG